MQRKRYTVPWRMRYYYDFSRAIADCKTQLLHRCQVCWVKLKFAYRNVTAIDRWFQYWLDSRKVDNHLAGDSDAYWNQGMIMRDNILSVLSDRVAINWYRHHLLTDYARTPGIYNQNCCQVLVLQTVLLGQWRGLPRWKWHREFYESSGGCK